MNREWYVFRIGMKQDVNKPTIGQPQLAAQRAPRRDGRRDALPLEEEAPPVALEGNDGYGYHLSAADTKDMHLVFTSQNAAEKYAIEQASLKPKTLFGVFSCVKVFETTTPSVVEKTYNDAGELLVVK
jgi:hypothetical protein